jgi:drug/metabolite transporter (DMT)-like permease
LPLLTMLVAALLRAEALTPRKSRGVAIAMAGVALALLTGLAAAPAGAWRGDLLMIGAALCMALYSVWSRPFIKRSGPVTFTTMGMAVGALGLIAISAASGGLQRLDSAGTAQWLAFLYVGLAGSTLAFFLWSFALSRTTPTRVAISVTVNPVIAAIVGAVLLGEAVGWNVVAGLAAVLAGIWIATTGKR